MIVMISSDFHSEYELYETDKPEQLINKIKQLLQGKEVNISDKILGTHDTIWTQDAIQQADKIVYISDLVQEG